MKSHCAGVSIGPPKGLGSDLSQKTHVPTNPAWGVRSDLRTRKVSNSATNLPPAPNGCCKDVFACPRILLVSPGGSHTSFGFHITRYFGHRALPAGAPVGLLHIFTRPVIPKASLHPHNQVKYVSFSCVVCENVTCLKKNNLVKMM